MEKEIRQQLTFEAPFEFLFDTPQGLIRVVTNEEAMLSKRRLLFPNAQIVAEDMGQTFERLEKLPDRQEERIKRFGLWFAILCVELEPGVPPTIRFSIKSLTKPVGNRWRE